MSALTALMLEDLDGPAPQGLRPLLQPLEARFGEALLGVILYGSCRRRDQVDEGLVDLLVIVSSYRQAYGSGMSAAFNRLLPPNVYYLEADSPQGRLRCKYAVISLGQFQRRCRHPVDLYFWARFSQPSRLVLARSDTLANTLTNTLAETLAAARAQAARHFAGSIKPLAPPLAMPVDFWSYALATTYRCELRPEPPSAARRLIEADADYWTGLSGLLAEEGQATSTTATTASGLRRMKVRMAWALRRLTGKLYNLARLFKAAGTFSNGIDYIVWKVERHSGVRVEPTERMRRHPRLAAWGLAWRMWRQKGFR